MMTIPLAVSDMLFDLMVVFDDEGMTQIKAYDPAEVIIQKIGQPWNTGQFLLTGWRVRNICFLYANEEEMRRLSAVADQKELMVILRTLARGWKFKPSVGDNDLPYQKPGKN